MAGRRPRLRGSASSAVATGDPPTAPKHESEVAPQSIPPPAVTPRRVLGYISLTESEQRLDRSALVSQEALIREECAHRGWPLVGVICEHEEATGEDERPGLTSALERLAGGEASCLVVSGLDRLGRSVVELGCLVKRIEELETTFVSLDFGIDTASPAGALVAHAFAGMAQRERENIAAQTRNGLAAARAEGRPISRPAVSDKPLLRERIAKMRSDGMTLQAIADMLNAEGVPTLRGGALWRPSSVQTAAGYRRPSGPVDEVK